MCSKRGKLFRFIPFCVLFDLLSYCIFDSSLFEGLSMSTLRSTSLAFSYSFSHFFIAFTRLKQKSISTMV